MITSSSIGLFFLSLFMFSVCGVSAHTLSSEANPLIKKSFKYSAFILQDRPTTDTDDEDKEKTL